MWEYIGLGFFGLLAGGLFVLAVVKVVGVIRKRNTPATPEEQEAYRQKQRDMQPTSQELARRIRENQIINECARVQRERNLIITSGSTQPLPEWPRDSNGNPLC